MTFVLYTDFPTLLLSWYSKNKRLLPWRERQDDAYAVWISEIMLQQTTVNAVIDFYTRWMERFPTVESLAAAQLDDVLKQWVGLGYYARARNLHAAAKLIVDEYGGKLPQTVNDLMKLPGIGRYTAGAIASICYKVDAPILDANVIRVFCRLYALEGDPKTSSTLQKELWGIAELNLPSGEARDYNQALMELGALVCQPNAPRCNLCPVSHLCQAYQTGHSATFPQFADTKKWLEQVHAACLVEHDGKFLIVQRPLSALWGGLWELPRVIKNSDEDLLTAAARAVYETVGLRVDPSQAVGSVRHIVTNRKVILHGFRAEWDGKGELTPKECRQFAWVTKEQAENYALSSPQIDLLAQWQEQMVQLSLRL